MASNTANSISSFVILFDTEQILFSQLSAKLISDDDDNDDNDDNNDNDD